MNHLRTPSLAWTVGLVAVALSWPGCSSDEADSETPTFRYRSETEFCNQVGVAACSTAVVNGCGFNAQNVADISQCAAAVRSHCLAGDFDASRRRNTAGAVYQGAEAEACIQSVEKAHLDGTLTKDELVDINNRCDLVFSQRALVGGSCVEKADCAPSANPSSEVDCFYLAGQPSGTCAIVKRIQPGSSCRELGSVCVDDSRDIFCDGNNCVENVSGVAEPCLSNSCGATDRCLPNPDTTVGAPSKTCQPKVGDNLACARNEECVSGVCALRRDMATGQVVRLCTTQIQLNNIDVPVCQPYRQ